MQQAATPPQLTVRCRPKRGTGRPLPIAALFMGPGTRSAIHTLPAPERTSCALHAPERTVPSAGAAAGTAVLTQACASRFLASAHTLVPIAFSQRHGPVSRALAQRGDGSYRRLLTHVPIC